MRVIEGSSSGRDSRLRKITAACGISSQIIGLAALVLVVLQTPTFNWTTEHLSAFGVDKTTSILYNSGLIIGGTLSLIFAIGLGRFFLSGWLGKLAVGLFILGSLAAVTMGVFPRNWDFMHGASTVAFYVCITLALLATGAAALNAAHKAWGILSITAGVLVGGIQLGFGPLHGGAIGQLAAYLAWSLWTLALAVVLLVRPFSPD